MRKNVLKIRIDMHVDVDPSDVASVLAAAEKQNTVKKVLNDQGFGGIEFKSTLGTVEAEAEDEAAAE